MSTKPSETSHDPGAPFTQEGEESVLGSVLLDPRCFMTLSTFLKADDFFLLRHNYIWKAFDRLSQRRDAIDYITVGEELENMGTLSNIGGRAYLVQLVSNTGTAIHAEVYARLVERAAVRRKLMVFSDEVKAMAQDESTNTVEQILGEAEKKLFNISSSDFANAPVPMHETMAQYYDDLSYMMTHQTEGHGIPSGFRDIDQIIGGWRRGDLITIAARPGVGKTSLMLCLAMNAARYGGRVLMDTLEMPIEQLIVRMVSIEAGINVQKLLNVRLTPQEANRVVEVIGRMSEWNIWLWDTPRVTVPQLATQARRIRHENGLDLIIVDYVQLMDDHKASKHGNRVQEISNITREMKQMAKELKVPVIQGAQLSRAVEQRRDKRPQLSDLRESGSLEQDSDVVAFIYRDELYNEETEFPNQADIIFAKHRNGPTGAVSLYFEKSLTKFMDASVHRVDLSDLE